MRKVWNSFEEDIVRQLYDTTTNEAIGLLVGATALQVFRKAKAMGLKKSDEWYRNVAAATFKNGESHVGMATRFQKGQVPWNKGLKGATGNHPNTRRTQFKKGEMAGAAQHNYAPIGSTRVSRDGILERKVTDDPNTYPARRWVPVTRLVWEAANGPIPHKHVVRFLPGMTTTVESEITADRLECLSLAENMRRNTLHRYPKEIGDAIRARAVLNRRINHVEKHQRSA